ncbi:MAG TPA: bifunctional riboflavin kinase/FAD synthetase [Gemmatimonadaceae bacterium]|nr:bifunctional riboflavin kinase/FAD synthetase [Gemmatimonadaceae bacterium]
MPNAHEMALALPRLSLGSVITVGTFDGVHVGHRDLLAHVTQRAWARSLPSLLLTFDPHPLEIVNPTAAPPLLSTTEEKLQAIAESGLEYGAVLPFTPSLAALDAAEFVQRILLERFCVRELIIGYDHGFGRGRSGDVKLLRELGKRYDFAVQVVDVMSVDGVPVSSSAIRRAVSYGDLAGAKRMLGRRYSFSGRVGHGDERGRLLGFPTLNVRIASARKLLPPMGVYAVLVQSGRGSFGGMMNLGPRPTFGDSTLSFEVYLFDASGDWYDSCVRVEFIQRLRDTKRFDSPDALVVQLRADERAARAALTQVDA